MNWIKCKNALPPKDCKFLFAYYFGIGLGVWAQCYKTVNGNSERTHEAYILILHPSDILNGDDPFCWDEKYMIEMDVSWMPLPKPPED